MTSEAAKITDSRQGLRLSAPGDASAFQLFFIVLGGLPLFLPFILLAGENGLTAQHPISWYFWQNALLGTPHLYSTYIRLHRKIKTEKVSFLWGFPAYFSITAILAVCSLTGHFLAAATTINVWQSYHYLRQVYGVSRFVTQDCDETALQSKLMFWSYHLPVPLFVLGRWDTIFTVWQGKPSEFIYPVHIPSPLMNVCAALAIAGLIAGIVGETARLRRAGSKNLLPTLNLLVYYLLHYYGFVSVEFFQRGFYAVTIFHAVQYMSLSWWFEDKTRSEKTAAGRLLDLASTKLPGSSGFLYWAIVYGLASIWVWFATQTNAIWVHASTVLMMALSAHHYLVDTRIWRKSVGV